MAKPLKISWNSAFVKRLSKRAFVARFRNVYPGVDLSAEYDRIIGKKPLKKKADI